MTTPSAIQLTDIQGYIINWNKTMAQPTNILNNVKLII